MAFCVSGSVALAPWAFVAQAMRRFATSGLARLADCQLRRIAC